MKRTSSYRDGLVSAIRAWLPSLFFSQWALRQGVVWRPQRLVWMAVLMAWSTEQTLSERFEAVKDLVKSLFPKWRLGRTYTGYCDAWRAWSPHLQPALARQFRSHLLARAGAYRTREGWMALAADGSRVECPRTAANEQVLGCAGKDRTAPQLMWTTLWHMGTGLPWDFRIGAGTESERRHLEAMLSDLPADALVVADAGFVGFDLCQRIIQSGQSFLLRVGANVHLLQELGYYEREGPNTVYLWPQDRQHEAPLVLRLIVVEQEGRRMHLVTNVLDETRLSQASAIVLYELRWGIEVFYRSFKQTLQRRKMLSQTPELAKLELTWAVMSLWLLGLMSVTALLARGIDPLGWSVALARQVVRRAMRQASVGRRGAPRFTADLGHAVQDGYVRGRSKKARNWPHKKREKPPGTPKIQLANAAQVKRAKELQQETIAA